jgi:hypothetical protein
MRKGILGLLACVTAVLAHEETALGQSGGYQEPLPIGAPGVRYVPSGPASGFAVPSRFPGYMAPAAYSQAPQVPSYGPPPIFGVPTYRAPSSYGEPGGQRPAPDASAQSPRPPSDLHRAGVGVPTPATISDLQRPGSGVVPTAAQETLPPPRLPPSRDPGGRIGNPSYEPPPRDPGGPPAEKLPNVPPPVPTTPPVSGNLPSVSGDSSLGALTRPRSSVVSPLCVIDPEECLPPEPAEPFMVGPESTWKFPKGYIIYGSAEYLYWVTKAQPLTPNLPLSVANPGTTVTLSDQWHSGGRFNVGMWVGAGHNLALEGGYFFLATKERTNNLSFPPTPVVVKPVFDGVVTDSTQIVTATSFSGAELNLRWVACRLGEPGASGERRCVSPIWYEPVPFWVGRAQSCTAHLDFLGGFRFVDLSESLALAGRTAFGTAPVLLSNAVVTNTDLFGTHNHFYAGQIGFDSGIEWGRLSVGGFAKLALGDNRQTMQILGTTQVSGPPVLGNFTVPGGFFAQASNSGRFRHDQYSMLPESGVNIGLRPFDRCRLSVGYMCAYFWNVARPGDQIDRTAGGGTRPPVSFLTGTQPRPTFNNFNETSFWAQGINLTVEVSY